ncbi:hypothetical protein-signal peptide prediction [Rhodopirellula baltica SH 1]|uniref:Uncharacterized protein n=1 Tax=Rhodopirellula baltica (strain DSM 10527 / NCIMB 13988 / SH1) TaxID=243090 RepID=Q7UWP9_RHOBA|nr:hypothetical protein-signal peptide prediction [Rhodopirellula baltica SH 1]
MNRPYISRPALAAVNESPHQPTGLSPMAITLQIHPPPGRVERSEGRAAHRVLGSPSPARSGRPSLREGEVSANWR